MSLESLFDEHMPRPEEYYTKIWENAIVVLDTNILLNLYRFSDNTRDKLFDALERIKDRIWIPYWVGKEYVKNRPNVIGSQMKELSAPIMGITDFLKLFESKRTHPHLADETKKQLLDIQQSITDANAETSKILSSRLRQDDIMERINKLLGDNIGAEPTDAELSALVADGEIRAKSETPPGYGDYEKKRKDNPFNPYAPIGDLIIWDAMKKKASSDAKPIIFICDDEEKGDWVLKQSGQTIGPFPSLLKEFKKETGQEFHIYNSFQFMNYFQEPGVDSEVLEELKEFATTTLDSSIHGIEHVDANSNVPHFEILRNQAGAFYWRFVGDANITWFTSQVNFGDISSCITNIDNIRQYAQLPLGLSIRRYSDGFHTLEIHNSQGINEVHSYLSSRDPENLNKMIPAVASWVQMRNIVFV